MRVAEWWALVGGLAIIGVLIVVANKPRRHLLVFYLGCLALSIVTYVAVPIHGGEDLTVRAASLFTVICLASVWVAVKVNRVHDLWAFAVLGMLAIATPVFAALIFLGLACAGGNCD